VHLDLRGPTRGRHPIRHTSYPVTDASAVILVGLQKTTFRANSTAELFASDQPLVWCQYTGGLFVSESDLVVRFDPDYLTRPFLPSVPANVAATFAGRTRSGDLLGTQIQDGLDGLPADAVDHFINGQPG
jgi:hypothetical protein